MELLIIGGSGFASGACVRRALGQGHDVTIVTRGTRPVPDGVTALTADRRDPGRLEKVLDDHGGRFDGVIDYVGFQVADGGQDRDLLAARAAHLVFISTDFVYRPDRRRLPQPEDAPTLDDDSYGGKKRQIETIIAAASFDWTILRPGHIYGPGARLGCLPLHGRDPELTIRIDNGEPLRLAAEGRYLQQPVYVDDLADVALGVMGSPEAVGAICNVAGPEIIESRRYYEMVAELMGCVANIESVSTDAVLAENPAARPFLCHRIYDLERLAQTGAPVPATPMIDGLARTLGGLVGRAPQ